jgi:CRP-like cAMP-binding protein
LHILHEHILQFVTITNEEFGLILNQAKRKALKKNQLLLEAGKISLADFFILSGCVKQYHLDQGGQEHVLQYAFPGWWVGDWYSILNNKSSAYYIEALTTTEALEFSVNNLEQLFQQVPQLERYFRIIFQRAFAAQQKRILWLQMPLKDRYQEFVQIYGYFEKMLSQREIASYLGTTRESLSRLKKKNRL